jgi:hypothetical protein
MCCGKSRAAIGAVKNSQAGFLSTFGDEARFERHTRWKFQLQQT